MYDVSICCTGSTIRPFSANPIWNGPKRSAEESIFCKLPEREEPKKLFIKEALLLRQALSLCQSLLNYEQRLEAAYFEAVRTLLTRIEGKGKMSLREINARINELLKQSIKSDGVINLFSDVEEEFSLFDPKFLEEISRMKERNFAVELLRKLIAE